MEDIFRKNYYKYKNDVFRLAYSYTKRISDAEDIMQNVFMKYYNNINILNDADYLKKWLFKVTVNECKNYKLSIWKRIVFPIDENEKDLFSYDKEFIDVRDCIFALPSKYRMIIYLYYYQGYKVKEIAEILNKNKSTIQTNLNRAREMLKEKLKGELRNE